MPDLFRRDLFAGASAIAVVSVVSGCAELRNAEGFLLNPKNIAADIKGIGLVAEAAAAILAPGVVPILTELISALDAATGNDLVTTGLQLLQEAAPFITAKPLEAPTPALAFHVESMMLRYEPGAHNP